MQSKSLLAIARTVWAIGLVCAPLMLISVSGVHATETIALAEASQTTCDIVSCESDVLCSAPECRDGLLGGLIEKSDHRNTGFLDFNFYRDTREFNILTVNAGAKLPYDFEYFQFVNFTSPLNDPSESEDWNDFFTEIHLRRPIASDRPLLQHLDWSLMWADGGFVDEVGRFGIRWRLQDTPGRFGAFLTESLKLRYSLTFHILEDDGSGWQLEHFYRRQFFDGLAYVAGFADHNINSGTSDSDWVTESQVGLKVAGNFYVVAEYRYNSFLPAGLRSGLGIGIEYFVPFQ